ncbi:MAG: L-rhamnose/proton symporter RhaT [candidate division KSB1 bacterium]|nr:L-rhamnose/proton symporter RhaT [candidate division KSB1 bacterium]
MSIFFPETLLQPRGLVLLAGMALTVLGIVLCSRAGARKTPVSAASKVDAKAFASGLLIAIFAGILSCLPNVGMAFGTNVIRAARLSGVSDTFSGNVVWALFYTIGFAVNFAYCVFLMLRRKTTSLFFNKETKRNLFLAVLMGIMWIGSFYLYGMSTAKLGQWGVIVGWPLFITLSIVIGNLWGIWRGEWKQASPKAKKMLYHGIAVLIAAVIVVGISNSL